MKQKLNDFDEKINKAELELQQMEQEFENDYSAMEINDKEIEDDIIQNDSNEFINIEIPTIEFDEIEMEENDNIVVNYSFVEIDEEIFDDSNTIISDNNINMPKNIT